MSVHFACFRPSPSASLPEIPAKVLAVLRDARGIFRSNGFKAGYIALRSEVTVSDAQSALHDLEVMGLAERVTESLPIRHAGAMRVTRWRSARG